MRSLNIIALVFVSCVAYACGSSTPPAESPSEATAEAPADAPVGDAGAPAP